MVAAVFERTVTLDGWRIFTPLGVRFWDPVSNSQVSTDLLVTAQPPVGNPVPITAVRTFSGIYAFHRLPGLLALAYPDAAAAMTSPPVTHRFLIQVADRQRRFLAMAFSVDLPFPGIFPTGAQPALNPPPGVYLFSAPTRSPTPTQAVVRAQLTALIGATRQAAAYAVLEVTTPDGQLWYGLADEHGQVATLFPYPTFSTTAGGPPSPPPPVQPRQWLLTVRVRYAPAWLVWPTGARSPDLASIFSQPLALLWSSPPTPGGQPLPQLAPRLSFGEELVLRTATESSLLLSPAVSSP
jgi:hypothetical protein